jgi:uncharacterized protein YggE
MGRKQFPKRRITMGAGSKITLRMFAGALLVLAGCGDEVAEENYAYHQISVTGNGMAGGEPDLAVIVAGIDLTLDDPAEVVNTAADAAEAFIQAARDAGVAEDEMQTTSYSLWVEDEYDPYTYNYTGRKVYHLTHYVRFEVRELDRVGEVLAAVIGAGANSVSGVSFAVEDQAALGDSAYVAAVRDAEHRAGLMAEAMGVELGEATYVSQYGSAYQVSDQSAAYGYGLASSTSEVSIPAVTSGSFRMSAQVSVTYEIRGKD